MNLEQVRQAVAVVGNRLTKSEWRKLRKIHGLPPNADSSWRSHHAYLGRLKRRASKHEAFHRTILMPSQVFSVTDDRDA